MGNHCALLVCVWIRQKLVLYYFQLRKAWIFKEWLSNLFDFSDLFLHASCQHDLWWPVDDTCGLFWAPFSLVHRPWLGWVTQLKTSTKIQESPWKRDHLQDGRFRENRSLQQNQTSCGVTVGGTQRQLRGRLLTTHQTMTQSPIPWRLQKRVWTDNERQKRGIKVE